MLYRRTCIECVYIYKGRLSFWCSDKLNVNRVCHAAFAYHSERIHYTKTHCRKYTYCLRYFGVYVFLKQDGGRYYKTDMNGGVYSLPILSYVYYTYRTVGCQWKIEYFKDFIKDCKTLFVVLINDLLSLPVLIFLDCR